jgi:hypothetical protein
LAVAGSADAPPGAALHLGSIDAEQPQALRPTSERVAIDDVGARTINYHANPSPESMI